MALQWNWKDLMGTMAYHEERKDGQTLDYTVNLYLGNCLCVALYEYEKDGEQWHQLHWFLGDEQHLKNILKNSPHFFDDVKSIRLNLYYKQALTLQRYLTRLGFEVTTYYSEPEKSAGNDKQE